MFVTKKHKGITITILNPEAIPIAEERIRKLTAKIIMAEQEKLLLEKMKGGQAIEQNSSL